MCRNIKTLFNFEPAVTPEEVRDASLQFVRKITGFHKPSKANEAAFASAVDEIADVSMRLLRSLETNAPPKNREEEAAKAKARAAVRFGASGQTPASANVPFRARASGSVAEDACGVGACGAPSRKDAGRCRGERDGCNR